MAKINAQDRAKNQVVIQGRILYRSGESLHVWTPLKDLWIPLSEIRASTPPKDELKEGDEVTMVVPLWLARDRGLIE